MSISTIFLLCCSLALLVFCCLLVIQVQPEYSHMFLLIMDSTIKTRNHAWVIMIGRQALLCLRFALKAVFDLTASVFVIWVRVEAKMLLWAKRFPQQQKIPLTIIAESLKGGVSNSGEK